MRDIVLRVQRLNFIIFHDNNIEKNVHMVECIYSDHLLHSTSMLEIAGSCSIKTYMEGSTFLMFPAYITIYACLNDTELITINDRQVHVQHVAN